jgi:ubiquinone/menaquinone biosynthesis C-methylase UbiE
MAITGLASAAQAFDAIAADFDARFCPWRSVEAQRRAVRRVLAEAFPPGARLIEIGGGTGEDASWLARRGCDVLMTDASPGMVSAAAAKCGDRVRTRVAAAEDFGALADALGGERAFDGAYSVFAALNCVTDLSGFAEGIARLLRPGAELIIVVFGAFSPGEMLVEVLRGRPRNALRRLNTGAVNARLGGRDFSVRYHRRRDLVAALGPWFDLESRQGIGVFVPPSAAEPWISRHPVLLRSLETLDRWTSRELALFGDHILYRFVRAGAET